VIYASFPADVVAGRIAPASDVFHLLLVNGYTPDAAHSRRLDVQSFEPVAPGYDKGGKPVGCSVRTTDNKIAVVFADTQWTVAGRLTATGAVVYHARGSAAEDELVCFVDFGKEVSASDSSFAVHFASGIAVTASAL
jgi:hypothetical protein